MNDMNTEADCIKKISEMLNNETTDAKNIFNYIDMCIGQHHESAKLYCLKGDLIQIIGSEDFSIADSLDLYEKSISIDPTFAEGYTEIGNIYYTYYSQLDRAEYYFRKAIELGGNEDSYIGLAHVLIDMGNDKQQIIKMLTNSPYITSEILNKFVDEISEY